MNVSSSTTTQLFQNTSTSSKNANLSSEQKDIVDEVLSKFDTNSLSASDATEIVEAFKEAGIEPSYALSSAMEASGFDAKEVGDLAASASSSVQGGGRPAGGPPPPPSEEEEEEIASIYDLLETLLSSEEDEDTSATSTASISSIISGTGYDSSDSSSFETVLDYTSKIVRLNDDAKSDVMSLINEYNTNETNLNSEESQKNLLTSLSEILKKTDNYNTMSFYA